MPRLCPWANLTTINPLLLDPHLNRMLRLFTRLARALVLMRSESLVLLVSNEDLDFISFVVTMVPEATTKKALFVTFFCLSFSCREYTKRFTYSSRHMSFQLNSCQTPRTLGSSHFGIQAVLRTRFGGGSRQGDEWSFRSSTPLPHPPTHRARCRVDLSSLHRCRYQRARKFRYHHAAWRLPGSLPFDTFCSHTVYL